MPIPHLFSELKEANELTGVGELLRRYFAMNGFDGTLITLGIVFGSFLAGVQDARIVLFTVIAASIAMAVSGFGGTYLTEKSERRLDILHLENRMLIKLHNTKLAKAAKLASLEASLVNGLSPFVMAIVITTPFALAKYSIILIQHAYIAAIGLGFTILFFLGVFLGRISQQNKTMMGFKMVAAGVLSLTISLLLRAGI